MGPTIYSDYRESECVGHIVRQLPSNVVLPKLAPHYLSV